MFAKFDCDKNILGGLGLHPCSETELNAGVALAPGRGFERRQDMFNHQQLDTAKSKTHYKLIHTKIIIIFFIYSAVIYSFKRL